MALNPRLRAFIFYSADNIVIPNSLKKVLGRYPTTGKFLEIPRGCCAVETFSPIVGGAKKRLKAFVRLDKTGTVVEGPIIRKSKPTSWGFFAEVPYDLCCQEFAQAVQITTQPSSQTVIAGQNVTFTVVATGTNLTYQWFRDGSEIPGATSASYSLTPAEAADSGAEFYVVVSNSLGTTQSSTATLTVDEAIAIDDQPQSQTVNEGDPVTFFVTLSAGTNPTYQWFRNGSPISGATSDSYTIPATTVADDGDSFSVDVTNTLGTVSSNAAVLTVTPTP